MREIDMSPSIHLLNLTPKTREHLKVPSASLLYRRLSCPLPIHTSTSFSHHRANSPHHTDPNPNEAEQKAAAEKRERGEKTAENIRYGEAISEHGMGGETVGNTGGVNPLGGEESVEEKGDKARHAQGYGPGSGVGA